MFNAMLADMAERTERNTSETALAAGQLVEKVAALEKQLEETKRELEQARQQMADRAADEDRKRAIDKAERIIDGKKQRRDTFVLAALNVIFTLLVEFGPKIVNLLKLAGEP